MANIDWRLAFHDAFVEILHRLHSNHNPILMRCGGLPEVRGQRIFRFEAAWIVHEDYQQVMEGAWHRGQGSLGDALNYVREASITFNTYVFGNIFRKKIALENRIRGMQKSLERVDFVRLVLLEQEL